MTQLLRFMDNDRRGRWATFKLASGEPCWLSIAQTGVLVKRSRFGLFGAKLWEEKDLYAAAKTVVTLQNRFAQDVCPETMANPALRAFASAILHCDTGRRVGEVLREVSNAASAREVATALDEVAPAIDKLSRDEQLDVVVETAFLVARTSDAAFHGICDGLEDEVEVESFRVHVLFTALGVASVTLGALDSAGLAEAFEDRVRNRLGPEKYDLLGPYREWFADLHQQLGGDIQMAAGHLVLMTLRGAEDPSRDEDHAAQLIGTLSARHVLEAISQLQPIRDSSFGKGPQT